MKLLTCFTACLLSVAAYGQYSLQKLDVNPQGGSNPHHFTSFKGKTYFIAIEAVHGYELRWTDGITTGVAADIWPGSVNGIFPSYMNSGNLCVMGDKLYFPARDSAHRTEIWAFDGSNAPHMVMDLDTFYDERYHLTDLNGQLYFQSRSVATGSWFHIFKYNPVTKAVAPVTTIGSVGSATPMIAFNGKLLYAGVDGELNEYDPLGDSVKILPISSWPQNPTPNSFHVFNNRLYFIAQSITGGAELFSYDGFSQPQQITVNITNAPNAGSFAPPSLPNEIMAMYNGRVYFMAQVNGSGVPLRSLFSYEPSTGVQRQEVQMRSSVSPLGMAVYGRKLYLVADSNQNGMTALYSYDGTNLTWVAPMCPSSFAQPTRMKESNGRLYFVNLDQSVMADYKEPAVLTDSNALGMADVIIDNGIIVHPNPATTEATISFTLKQAAKLNVQLTDIQGRVVYATKAQSYVAGKQEIKMPVQELATGIYIYAVMNEAGEILAKGQLVKK